MSEYNRVYNFSAGPGVLPVEVLEQARDEMMNWHGAGLSVMEMSHRSKPFDQIMEEAEADCRKFLSIPDNYKVLFLQGGASLQFTMLAKNLLPKGASADYVVTGEWGKKAVKAAKLEGSVNVIWDGKETNYDRAPDYDFLNVNADAAFVHTTLNETIQGVDYFGDPWFDIPVICDMSSNIGSRQMDFSRYAMIYAGAQKNLGPAGLTLVIIRDDFLEGSNDEGLPEMLSYKAQAANGSRFNTPPCWSIYVCGLVFKHWLARGGVATLEKLNAEKAGILYSAMDDSGGYYRAHAVPENRSQMNVPFVLPDEDKTKQFLQEAEAQGFLELKGHRSIGGCRASIYNSFPKEGVEALASFMKDFAQRNG